MIAYTMVGTRDLEQALTFYDPLFAEMSWDVCWKDEACVSYGKETDLDFPRFIVGYPFDGHEAGVGNGTMTAFQFAAPEQVDRLYEIAIRNGGSDEGAPGYRPQYAEGFYAAYVRDRDGNKLAFVVYPREAE
ncbi:VOC family protein [Billgrantia ethanolica]|uniref:VOC family protein n=1 Tax=Billgrantia ethanolica TaxID=2733486 RepID=A0ABS9A689_9GAMM|nr:VOC family protein [Halomonas ethanolica]MCE8004120.1 VOC family protein [Halomonas ethanolica]